MTEPIATRDVTIPSSDGVALQARAWSVPAPRGVVVVSHGFGEHGGFYDHVAHTVGPSVGVDFLAPDLRGHGRSPGRRGVVTRFDELTDDLIAAFDWAGRERPGLPRFVLGHSNGGQVALRMALHPTAGPAIAGLILSNPSLRLAFEVPRLQVMIGRLLQRFAPRLTLAAPLEVERLTRDPEMQALRLADELSHQRISPHLYFGMVEGVRMIRARAAEIVQPLLVILGGSDPIIDPIETQAVYHLLGSPDKSLRLYPEMLHEPFNEVGRERVLADLVSWLSPRLPPHPDASPP